MKEKIQEDRKNIHDPGSSLTYIPLLRSKAKTSLKLSRLSSLNILYYLEESFKRGDKFVLRNLDRMAKELRGRSDIFQTAMMYLQDKTVKDDLFYWLPGHRVSNIFCFIAEIIPDFVERYKKYYVEMVVSRREYYDVLHFIRGRYEQDYAQFKMMQMDLELFPDCISATVWVGKEPDRNESNPLGIRKIINISPDIEAILVPQASFVDVSIGSRTMVVSVEDLNGLVERREECKQYWMEKGVTDNNWNWI